MKSKKIKVGDIFKTKEGFVTVLDFINCNKVLVEHNDQHKHQMIVQAGNLRTGVIKNPYYPSVFGVGYIGVGKYKATDSGKHTSAYSVWKNMLKRCYSKEIQKKQPTYIGCSVSKEWLNFQVFSEWYYSQPNAEIKGFALDKDLIILNNKVYSSKTCSLMPQEINSLLLDSEAIRGYLPQGVIAMRNGYQARIRIKGVRISLGTYSTKEKAFCVYKKAKEENVKMMAGEYKDFLHPLVYETLLNWELKKQ